MVSKEHRPEYFAWSAMKYRCGNPRARQWPNYGARGITVCERWHSSFKAFFADMGPRPAGMSLDRINNDGNYEPGNCRWATPVEQGRNRRDNHVIAFRGESKTLTEWAIALGVKKVTLCARLKRYGYDVERALTLPIGHHRWRHAA